MGEIPASRLLGWVLGTTSKPMRSQTALAKRIIEAGAPDLAHLLTVVDVEAAREVIEMAEWPRLGSWRIGTDDAPSPKDVAMVKELMDKYGESSEAEWLICQGIYPDHARALLDAAKAHGVMAAS